MIPPGMKMLNFYQLSFGAILQEDYKEMNF
jgi:hypothetical protein